MTGSIRLALLSRSTTGHVREPLHERSSLSTPGVLGSGRSSVVSSPQCLLRPHPPVSRARGDFASSAYTPRLRCAGTPRRPTRPSLLSLLHCPHVPSTIRRWVRNALPLSWRPDTRLPQLHNESPPTVARLCQPSLTRRSLSTLHRSLYATARVFASPSWLATTRLPTPPEDFVTLAFAGRCRHLPVRVRLDGRTGNLPSSGLAPDKCQQLVRLHAKPGFMSGWPGGCQGLLTSHHRLPRGQPALPHRHRAV